MMVIPLLVRTFKSFIVLMFLMSRVSDDGYSFARKGVYIIYRSYVLDVERI
jgi:hypothetical protein